MGRLRTKVLWTLFLLGTALDAITTIYLVSLYGVEHEANLLARAFMEMWGPVWGTVFHNLWGVGLVWGLWKIAHMSTRLWARALRESLDALMVVRIMAPINNFVYAFTGVALIDVLGFTTFVFVSALGFVVALRLWRR